VYGNAGGQPAGLLNTPGNVGGTFTWDLDEANPETRSVGRIPRLGRFLENLAFVTPEDADFSEDIPFRIVRMDIVSGVLEDGSRFSLALEGDDEWVRMSSEQTGPGYPAIDFYSPGAIYYSSHRDFTDILLTCAIGEEMIATDGFGVYTNRIGPDEAGRFKVYVYDFSRKAWRQFTPDQTPADNDPQPWLAEPWPGAPAGLSRYLEPGTNRMYIRVMTSAITDGDYHYRLDFVEVQGLTGSDRPN
jgi:hypothetical protein